MRQYVSSSRSLAARDADLTIVPIGGVWDDRLGAMIAIAGDGSTHVGDVCVIEPDGQILRIGQGGLARTGIGWSYDDFLVLADAGGIRKVTDWPSFSIVSQDITSTLVNFAVMPDRRIHFDGNNVLARGPGAGSSTTETAIDTGNDGPGWIFPFDLSAGKNLWWLCDLPSGKLYLYDAIALAEVGTPGTASSTRSSFGGLCNLIAYSRKHDVFARVVSPFLSFTANEPAAYAVSAPAFSDIARAGQRRQVSATVTGSDGERCPGRTVTLSATAGDIPVPIVNTDSLGVATTYYYGPQDPSTGETLTAELVQ